ncbi:MAG: DUF1569 domain-containing protein [Cyclobacteriaceae bacterium]
MKSLFEQSSLAEIETRINNLSPESTRQWGKMEIDQMLAHCAEAMEVVTGQRHAKRGFLGYILGPLLKAQFYNDEPASKNSPTANEFIIRERKNFNDEKNRLMKLVKQFHDGGEAKCTSDPHAFFGKLTAEQWGKGVYKHLDHHLKQFSA